MELEWKMMTVILAQREREKERGEGAAERRRRIKKLKFLVKHVCEEVGFATTRGWPKAAAVVDTSLSIRTRVARHLSPTWCSFGPPAGS